MKLCLCVSQNERQRVTTTVCLPVYQHLYSHCCYVYIHSSNPVQPVCTFLLHIPAYIIIYLVHSILYCTFYFIAHFTLYFVFLYIFFFYLYLCLSSCVVLHILHCPLSVPDLTISLLIIFCIIENVTNKNLDIDLDLDLSYPVLIFTFSFSLFAFCVHEARSQMWSEWIIPL